MFLTQAPSVERDTVLNFHVKVQGGTFSSEEVRKVMVMVYQPRTFIQTDKPIYLPGQTGKHNQIINSRQKLQVQVYTCLFEVNIRKLQTVIYPTSVS